MKKRLRAREAKVAHGWSDAHGGSVCFPEKAEEEAHSEFRSDHPGYCGAEDAFRFETQKGGVGSFLEGHSTRRCSMSSMK